MAEANRPIIIKKIKKSAGGHHGGSWKVAYADFVTAMMAFFLLMWLLASASEPVKKALSYYFTKFSVFETGSGVMPVPKEPSKTESKEKQKSKSSGKGDNGKSEATKKLQMAIDFKLAQFKDQIEITAVPEGIRVNISDKTGQPMFLSGAAQFQGWSAQVLKTLAEEMKAMPNPIAIEGHTDATPFGGGNLVTNWELSTQRAMAARRALEYYGVPQERYARIIGYADKQLMYPDAPTDPRNRRISFIVQFTDEYKQTPDLDSIPTLP